MKKHINVNWRSITSSTPLEDREQLEKFCELAPHGVLAIEIGSYEGGSTAILSQYFDIVIAIDPWGGHDVKSGELIATYTENTAGSNIHFSPFIKNMYRLDIADRVIPIVGTVSALNKLPNLKAGLIFVDDGHTYSDCKRDIDASLFHLDIDGILVCHDYYNEFGGPCGSYIGVTNAVNDSIKEYDLEVIHHSGGIIALKRKIIELNNQ